MVWTETHSSLLFQNVISGRVVDLRVCELFKRIGGVFHVSLVQLDVVYPLLGFIFDNSSLVISRIFEMGLCGMLSRYIALK